MKINSKMIAFSDNGERGEKIVDVPLAGPIDRNRLFFPPQFYFLTRNGWNAESLFYYYFSCSFFIFLSSFNAAFCLFHNTKIQNLEHYMISPEVQKPGIYSVGLNLLSNIVFVGGK